MVAYDRAIVESLETWLDGYARTAAADDGTPPFFLVAGFLLPHCPFIAPPEVFDKYRGRVNAPRLTPTDVTALHPFHRVYRDQAIAIDTVPVDCPDYWRQVETLRTRLSEPDT